MTPERFRMHSGCLTREFFVVSGRAFPVSPWYCDPQRRDEVEPWVYEAALRRWGTWGRAGAKPGQQVSTDVHGEEDRRES
jgi:hypothetical protein